MDSVAKTCMVEGCERPQLAQSRCSKHYQAHKSSGEISVLPPGSPRASGENRAKYGSLVPSGASRRVKKTCVISGCDRYRDTSHLCGRHKSWMKKYKLTHIQIQFIIDLGECEICGIQISSSQIHIDHDHSCCNYGSSCGDCIRGALCRGCNLGLGFFRDNPAIMQTAIRYLESDGT